MHVLYGNQGWLPSQSLIARHFQPYVQAGSSLITTKQVR